MFEIIKILNNNALLATCKENNDEVVFLGKGVGFGRSVGNTFDKIDNSQQYRLVKETEKGNSLTLIDNISPKYLEISGEILEMVKETFDNVREDVLVTLADHINFSIERIKNNIILENPFTCDIKALYPKEFEIAEKSKSIIKEKTGFDIDEDEVGYITLHIHSSLSEDKVSQSMKIAIIIRETIEKIEQQFEIKIATQSLSYTRLMNHVNYMIARIRHNEKLNVDINDYISDSFPYSYSIAQQICMSISRELNKDIPAVEIGYLALHIERVKSSELGLNND